MSKQEQVSPRTTGLKYALGQCIGAGMLLLAMVGEPCLAAPSTELAAAIRAGDDARALQLLATALPAMDPAAADQAAPLLIAASRGRHVVTQRLLALGADPNPRFAAYLNATALMLAIDSRDAKMVELLLAGGAGVDLVDSQGDPALNWAVYYGDRPITELLLLYKARSDLVGHGNALEVAMRRGHQALVLRLLDYRGERKPLDALSRSLVRAIESDNAAAVKAALAAGAKPDALDETHRPVLALAARGAKLNALEALMGAGAKVDASDSIGLTPLMEAAREGHVAVCRRLRAGGASLSAQAAKRAVGVTPLHLAASAGRLEMISWLVAEGVPIDAPDAEGTSPLGWTGDDSLKAAAELLLSLGAKPLPPAKP
ncbi:ankyrin repeat domain-containing protein [Roseateles oligotrophus]|uniref:Ankyrin repeat domain-containing protein n=1 Tax=Roseateles oligotrophus TaxID=1769250 RepID=A0ABT2Y905_9BURK|nr:ankyrin repeat domain-containing protein [Roseateles oligotrophus]MCV2366544.1 ankyrin repeat domain-containing protein [Roseateles oligotrophus]